MKDTNGLRHRQSLEHGTKRAQYSRNAIKVNGVMQLYGVGHGAVL
jgi:hypothetical protein